MTNEEKQEIINAVLSAIMTNSKTIEQLTPTDSLSDNDAIEVSGGRRISYAAFLSAVQVGVQLMLDGYLTGESAVAWFAALENNPANYVGASDDPVQLHWRQSPIVLLDSMGEDLDGDDDFTAQVGDKWWDPSNDNSRNYIFLKTSTGQAGWPIGSGNVNDVLYVNKRTGRMYLWDGTDMVELVGATGGGGSTVTISRGGGYVDIDIIDNTPVIEVSTSSIVMSGDNKTATFTVSGHNLTAPIKINGGNAYFSKSPSSISPVGGIVEATTVTVTFGGSTDDTDDLIVSSPGATSQTVHVTYTAVAGPNIVVSPASLSFKAATSETDTKTVSVQGSLLDADVVVSTSSPFAVSLDGTTFNSSVTIPKATAMAGATVYVRYTAGSSATTGTLTLTSDGAADKTVDLTGAVSTLTVSPQSLTFSTDQGVAVTQSFTIQGTNLTNGVTLAVTGTNASMFSLDKNSLTKAEAEAGETITVTYTPTGSGNHSGDVGISWDGAGKSVTLQGTVVETPNFTSENNYRLQVNGIYYDVMMSNNAPTTDLRVNNSSYSATGVTNGYSGDIVIPSTISGKLDGVATTFTVKDIRTHAFSSCNSLNSVVVPDSVTAIHDYAFYGCSSLKRLVIGNGVAGFKIGSTNYNNVIGGSTVLDVADFGTAFMDFGPSTNGVKMSANGKVYMRWTGSRESGGNTYYHAKAEFRPFTNTDGTLPSAAKLYVPSGKVSNYQGSSDWAAMFSQDNILAIDE